MGVDELLPTTGLETEDESQTALRWRRAILKLSETLLNASDERSDLSPILLEAMHNALENLLVYGDEHDLMTLEEWLDEEENGVSSDEEHSPREPFQQEPFEHAPPLERAP